MIEIFIHERNVLFIYGNTNRQDHYKSRSGKTVSVLSSGTPLRLPLRLQEMSWEGSFQSLGRERHEGSGGDSVAEASPFRMVICGRCPHATAGRLHAAYGGAYSLWPMA